MAIAMVAMLAFGGTYAYFTDTATGSTTNSVLTGTVDLGASATVTLAIQDDETLLLPGDTLTMTANVDNTSDVAIWAFVVFDLTGDTLPDGTLTMTPASGWTLLEIDGKEISKDVYYAPVTAGGTVAITATGTFLVTADGAAYMGKNVGASATFAATQSRHLDTAAAAVEHVKTSLGITIADAA